MSKPTPQDNFLFFWLTIAFVILIAYAFAMQNFNDRIEKLEQRCDGRCQYGDKACKDHCDKLGHCPMDGR